MNENPINLLMTLSTDEIDTLYETINDISFIFQNVHCFYPGYEEHEKTIPIIKEYHYILQEIIGHRIPYKNRDRTYFFIQIAQFNEESIKRIERINDIIYFYFLNP